VSLLFNLNRINKHAKPARFLIAHRGDQTHATENTLAAFVAAAQAGALFLECDIQFTQDFVPVILHDHSLKKPGIASAATVSQCTYAELLERCGQHYRLLTFKALLDWLQQYPDITLFTELKPPILRRKSPKLTVQVITNMIPAALQTQIVLISQSALLVEACGRHSDCKTGWVAGYHRIPDTDFTYLFLPASHAHKAPPWQQRGVCCAVYTVNDAVQIETLLAAGIDLIETNYFGKMKRALTNV